MKEVSKIIKALARTEGELVKGDVGSGAYGFKFQQGETAEKVKATLRYLFFDLAVDLGIEEKFDVDKLSEEIWGKKN